MLSHAIALQGFQAIARWHSQIAEPIGDPELAALPPCQRRDVQEAFDLLATGELRVIIA